MPQLSRTLVLFSLLSALTLPAFAEAVLSANDLAPGVLTAPVASDPFVVLAKADKAVNVEAMDKARTADDGEVFNARIKLNGGGSAEFRAVKVTTATAAQLTIYTNSSSKTDARILKVVDEAGTVLAELSAIPDTETAAGLVTFALPKAGTYFVFSASGGINLYQLVLR